MANASRLGHALRGMSGHRNLAPKREPIVGSSPIEVSVYQELAHSAHLSASRFAYRFRAEFSEMPRRWIERQRFERPRQLLAETSEPIHVIAAAVGFSYPFHFTNRFRAVTGQAPSKSRPKRHP